MDVVALDGDVIVFVEVKARATDRFGAPEEAVDERKRRLMFRAASEFIRTVDADLNSARFDIVTVLFGDGIHVEHYEDAVPKQLYQYKSTGPQSLRDNREPL